MVTFKSFGFIMFHPKNPAKKNLLGHPQKNLETTPPPRRFALKTTVLIPFVVHVWLQIKLSYRLFGQEQQGIVQDGEISRCFDG